MNSAADAEIVTAADARRARAVAPPRSGEVRVAARHWMLGNVPPCLPRTIVAPPMVARPAGKPRVLRPATAMARRATEHSG